MEGTKEVYRLAKQTAAGESNTLRQRLPLAGVITKVVSRIYPGAELNLRLVPSINGLHGHIYPVIQFADGGKQYLDGDDDVNIQEVEIPIAQDYEIVVAYSNTLDPNDPAIIADPALGQLDFFMEFTVSYAGVR